MSKVSLQKGAVVKLNTQYALLITGGPYLFLLNGNVTPDADDYWHVITGPQVVPQGVGAYIMAYENTKELAISAFTPSDTAPVNPVSS